MQENNRIARLRPTDPEKFEIAVEQLGYPRQRRLPIRLPAVTSHAGDSVDAGGNVGYRWRLFYDASPTTPLTRSPVASAVDTPECVL